MLKYLNFLRIQRNFYHKKSSKMNIVYFRYVPDEPQFQISFEYSSPTIGINRQFNFDRKVTESVQTCMDRITKNVEKIFSKKFNKKKDKSEKKGQPILAPTEISIQLQNRGELLSQKTFIELFANLKELDLTLLINDDHLKVMVNLPWVNQITLPSSILAGFIVYPAKLDLQFSSKDESDLIWYRGLDVKSKNENDIIWEEVGQGYCYMPTIHDINYKLKVKCIPKNKNDIGPSEECISKCLVDAGPGFCPFETRHAFTSNKLQGNQFRVMTYNLLADYYCDSDYSRTALFPYCPPYALNIDYRKQLFIKEIIGYNSDIICLQEVDGKIFDLDLVPILETKCMKGNLRKKGTTAEGLATFYDTRRFELIEETGINIGSNIKTLDAFKELFMKIQSNEKLMDRISERSTTLQVSALQSKDNPGKLIIVANTHLYFHPNADHIRLLQIGFSMLFVKDFVNKLKEKMPGHQVDLIFCGDFNSVPECGIYKLMTEKMVPDDFIDWNSSPEEAVKNVTLNQEFNMKSAYGTPRCTTWTLGFVECIDYIFYQTDRLLVDQVNILPSDEELQAHAAIPSVIFPSDHIALVADLRWA